MLVLVNDRDVQNLIRAGFIVITDISLSLRWLVKLTAQAMWDRFTFTLPFASDFERAFPCVVGQKYRRRCILKAGCLHSPE